MLHILFICSRNQWRSPTAERIFRRVEGLHVRSAGTSERARRTVSAQDLRWADIVCVMEDKHRQRLLHRFPREARDRPLHVLGIPDDFGFMDPELIATIEDMMVPILAHAHAVAP